MTATHDMTNSLGDTADVQPRIAALEEWHPGWRVWVAGSGSPCATRRGDIRSYAPWARRRARWQMTLICDSWDALEKSLTEQAEIDETPGPWWDIFGTDTL